MSKIRVAFAFFLAIPLLAASLSGCDRVECDLHGPTAIGLSADGSKLVIVDSGFNRLLIADRDFRLLGEIRHPRLRGFGLDHLLVTADDLIAVPNALDADGGRESADTPAVSEVLFFNFSGDLVKSFSWTGRTREIAFPSCLAATRDGGYLLADGRRSRIFRLDRAGSILSAFGSFGHRPGDLYAPHDMRFAADGNLLVADRFGSTLQLFTPEGRFLRTVAGKGEEEGRVMFPQYLCRDEAGNVYCSEFETMRISVFSADLRFIKTLRPYAARPPEGKFFLLSGLAFLEGRGLLACDYMNNCLHVFDPEGRWLRSVDRLLPAVRP